MALYLIGSEGNELSHFLKALIMLNLIQFLAVILLNKNCRMIANFLMKIVSLKHIYIYIYLIILFCRKNLINSLIFIDRFKIDFSLKISDDQIILYIS